MKSFRDIRVIPVVLVAIFGLVVLKVAGLVIDGGYVFSYQPERTVETPPVIQPPPASPPQQARKSWAQDMLGFPGGAKSTKADSDDITGSVPAPPKEPPKPAAPVAADPPPQQSGTVVFPEPNQQSVSPSERAILERLQARRQELEQRAREVEIRESLLKSAEKRIEGRVEEMKATEARITTATGQKAETDAARFKGIITMYE
ncbi:MAG: hypothetical protein ACREDP_08760, partial [Bradyrhizobium sp.]